jgi:hypothetical protein
VTFALNNMEDFTRHGFEQQHFVDRYYRFIIGPIRFFDRLRVNLSRGKRNDKDDEAEKSPVILHAEIQSQSAVRRKACRIRG